MITCFSYVIDGLSSWAVLHSVSKLFQSLALSHQLLCYLRLSFFVLNEEKASLITKLVGVRDLSVTSLNGSSTVISARISQLSSLRILKLDGTSIGDEGLRSVASLPHLENLDVQNCSNLTEAGIQFLSTALSLQRLNLAYLPEAVTENCLLHLSSLTSLRLLDVSQSNITGANLASLRGLQYLNLCGCNLMDEAGFAAVATLVSLQVLHVNNSLSLTDRDVSSLACLPALKIFHFSNCPRISDASITALGASDTICDLDFSHCEGISDVAMLALANLTTLKSLTVTCCNITDQYLSKLASLPLLEELALDSCVGITDNGIHHFAALNNLKRLDLSGIIFYL